MDIEITYTKTTAFDDSACIDYEFMYDGEKGDFEVYIGDCDLGYILEFDGNTYEWCVEENAPDENDFDPKFKEAFEKCFFVKIP